jgi:hypothetical protein
MTGYADKGVLDFDDLPLRDMFLKGGTDPSAEDGMDVSVHRLDVTGVPAEEPWFTISFLHAKVLALGHDERVQYVINSEDDGKAYFFGRMHRMYSVSGFLIDSDLSPSQKAAMSEEGIIAGGTSNLWTALYDRFLRASECVRRRLVISVKWRENRFWGYILGTSLSGTADNDNLALANFNLISVRDDLAGVLPIIDDRRISEKPFNGLLTREGAGALNIIKIPNILVPIPTSKMAKITKGRSRVPGDSDAGPQF